MWPIELTIGVECATITLKGGGGMKQSKTISMSVRVSEDELKKLKVAADLLSYSSCSEFVRRTALMEANKVITEQTSNTANQKERKSQL